MFSNKIISGHNNLIHESLRSGTENPDRPIVNKWSTVEPLNKFDLMIITNIENTFNTHRHFLHATLR